MTPAPCAKCRARFRRKINDPDVMESLAESLGQALRLGEAGVQGWADAARALFLDFGASPLDAERALAELFTVAHVVLSNRRPASSARVN